MLCSLATEAAAQRVALKTNALTWAATTPSLGVEVAAGRKVTLDLQAAYNPWTFKNDKKMRCWAMKRNSLYTLFIIGAACGCSRAMPTPTPTNAKR